MISSIDMIVVSETNPEVRIRFKPTHDPTSKLDGVVESLRDYFGTQHMKMNTDSIEDKDGALKYLVMENASRGNVRIKHKSNSRTERLGDLDFPITGTATHQEDFTIYFNFDDEDFSEGYRDGYVSYLSPPGSSHTVHSIGQNESYSRY